MRLMCFAAAFALLLMSSITAQEANLETFVRLRTEVLELILRGAAAGSGMDHLEAVPIDHDSVTAFRNAF